MPATPEASGDGIALDEATAMHWLMPLHFFYERRQLELPPFDFLRAEALPETERRLLVHGRDMTPTLTEQHGAELRLEVLDLEKTADYLMRIVILRRADNLLPVECGAIGIHLEGFDEATRRLIEEGRIPLGGILAQASVPHEGAPRGYFRVVADAIIANALGENEGDILYGRCNELSFRGGLAFADIVEILPRYA